MENLASELSDQVKALKAEIKRIRAAAQRVLDAANFDSTDDLMDFEKELRSLQREMDRVSPSDLLFSGKAATARKFGRRH